MSRKIEREPKLKLTMFDSGDDYDRYLRERGIEPYDGARTKGIRYRDGSVEVVINHQSPGR